SPATIYRLHSLLMNELRTLILPSDKIKEVRSRVGRTGFLPIELYELRFSDSFKTHMHASEALARACVTQATSIKHISSTVFPEGEAPISVFALNKLGVADPYSVITFAQREGAKLMVTSAWMVFHSDIGPCDKSDVIGLLRAFVESFGVQIV